MPELLRLEHFGFTYPQQPCPALADVSLTVRQGEFWVLCGASGCGKTTLLRQLKPALRPHGAAEGRILFDGQPLDDLPPHRQAADIGFVLQSPEEQTVTDKVWHELAFGLESLGCDTPSIRRRVAEMASFFGIQDWFHRKVDELSGGQKQLLALASVMVLQPRLLILDEPTSQLDPIAASDFLAVLGKINRELGTAVVLTEHRLEEAFPLATAVAVIVLVVCIAAVMLLVMPKFRLMQKLTDRLNGVTRENLTGIRVVRAYNAEDYQQNKFEKANTEFTGTQLFTGRLLALMSPIMMLVMNGLTLAIYWIGASLMNAGEIEYQTIVSFMTLASQVIMAFLMMLMMFILLPRASVAAKRINEVLETELSVKDPETETPVKECGTVEFRDVSFRYPDADADVFEHISFRAEKGQTIAFIGSTGSGKSTLINLVPRFYDATEGEVLVDGVNVKELKQSTLRDKIGYVPQKGVLFSGTVAENIAFGGKADRQEIEEAAKIAEADGFIGEMENGYDSPIAQGGKNVSGGQKQRLSIARAVATRPEIMIFDDSFSALDYRTDKQVRANLKEHLAGVTNLIVAQRIGTIMDADKIIVLDHGAVAGIGTHEQLLESCPLYREIHYSQYEKEEA